MPPSSGLWQTLPAYSLACTADASVHARDPAVPEQHVEDRQNPLSGGTFHQGESRQECARGLLSEDRKAGERGRQRGEERVRHVKKRG